MCNRRCCCPTYYARVLPNAGTLTADRGLRKVGNAIKVIDPPSSLDGIDPTLLAVPFAIDYRNRLTFQESRLVNSQVGFQTYAIYSEDMKLNPATRRLACSWDNVQGAGGAAFCTDWFHKRIYYAKGTQLNSDSTHPQLMELHSVEYGGFNDRVLYTNGYISNGGGNFFYNMDSFVWEPRTNRVYFREIIQNTTSLSTNPATGGSATYLRYLDADAGGEPTTVLSCENINIQNGDTLRIVNWFGVYASGAALITIENEQTLGTPGIGTNYLRLRNLDGTLVATLYAGPRNIKRCKVCEKDGLIYFEEVTDTPFTLTTLWKTSFASASDADWHKVFDSLQLADQLLGEFGGVGFGCRIERIGGDYAGAGYGLNV